MDGFASFSPQFSGNQTDQDLPTGLLSSASLVLHANLLTTQTRSQVQVNYLYMSLLSLSLLLDISPSIHLSVDFPLQI